MPKPSVWAHTMLPPAIQVSMSASSAANGAMNRGPGSGGAMSMLPLVAGSNGSTPESSAGSWYLQFRVTDSDR